MKKFIVEVPQSSAFSVMYRLEKDGANAVQADCTSITFKAYDITDSATVFSTAALTVATVVFNTLQTDGRWDADDTGYNFRHDIAHTIFTKQNRVYRLEYTVVWSDASQNIIDPYVELHVQDAWSV